MFPATPSLLVSPRDEDGTTQQVGYVPGVAQLPASLRWCPLGTHLVSGCSEGLRQACGLLWRQAPGPHLLFCKAPSVLCLVPSPPQP